MKKEILTLGLLVGIFAFASNALAVDPKEVEEGYQVQRVRGNNQTSKTIPIKNIPLQAQTQTPRTDGTETPRTDGTETPVQNQGQEQEQETDNIKKTGSVVAEQRRSQVANAVHEMLQVAERNGGIGEQVRVIVQAQNQNQEQLEASLEKVQKRNEFTKLFFGPDYKEIDKAKQVLAQSREQIAQLNQPQSQLTNPGDQQVLTQQIQLLEQANLEIETSLSKEKGGISLLGWMFKLFNK